MAVPPPPAPEKPALRAALRAARRAHVARLAREGLLDRAARAAAAHLLPHVPAGAVVALYHPAGAELDCAPLALALAGAGHALALPHVAADGSSMRFLRWTHGEPLERHALGMAQPQGDAEEMAPALIVAPLLGFDRAGGRLGQGAAFYDRAFAALPGAVRLGYAWSVQELDAVPRDPWDVPLHAVATEREWIGCRDADT